MDDRHCGKVTKIERTRPCHLGGDFYLIFFYVHKIATSKRKENVHNFGYKQGMVFFRKKSKDPSMLLAT